MQRRTFLKAAGAATLLPTLMPATKALANSAAPPNIVVILADDLGYGDLGSYGSLNLTPNLNQMAQEGVQFRQFYSASPVCSPSRASLLTGRYGVRTGVPTVLVPTDTYGLLPTEVTIAQMLKPLGYQTMCIGKWHLGRPDAYMPTTRGFDEYYGIPYSNDMTPSILMHNLDIIESPVDLTTITQRYTQQAVSFIAKAKNAPFFLYMPQTFPHIPLAASPGFVGKSGMGLYADVVQELDWSVGQVLAALAANGVDNNTLTIFTSDNGPWFQGSPGRLRGRKGDTFEGGLREPMIARFPARIPNGSDVRGPHYRMVDSMASSLDFLPTIAGFTNAPLPVNPLDGVDIGPVLTNAVDDVDRPLFFYFSNTDLQCARMGSWKLHMARGNVAAYSTEPKVGFYNLPLIYPELYNIDEDPEESIDASGQYPATVLEIQKRVAQALLSMPDEVQAAWAATQMRPTNPNTAGAYPTPILPQ